MSFFGKLKAAAAGVSNASGGGKANARQQRLDAEREAQTKMRAEPEKDFDAILSTLDKQYLDPEYDPVAILLGGIPQSDARMDAYLAEQKGKQQDLLDSVSHRLGREVVANYAAFIEGMRQIAEIDMDLSRASIHVSNSLRKLGSAKESLVTGTLGIAYRRRRRERLALVRGHLGFVQSLVRVEDIVAKACSEHRYADAVKCVTSSASKARETGMDSFSVCGPLKGRLNGALDLLLDRLGTVLDGQCLEFKPAVYGALLQAYRELDSARVKARTGPKHCDEVGLRGRAGTSMGDDMLGEGDGNDDAGLPGGYSDDVTGVRSDGEPALAYRGTGQSLLDVVGSSLAGTAGGAVDTHMAALPNRVQDSAAKAAKALSKDVLVDLLLKKLRAEMDSSGDAEVGAGSTLAALRAVERAISESGKGSEDASGAAAAADYLRRRAELKQRTFTDLAAMVPAEDVPAGCMRVAAAIAHVAHQHYLLLQWHRSPFDARACAAGDEGEFLHRCTTDEVDPDEEVQSRDPVTHAKARGAEATSPFASTLKGIRPSLLHGRYAVWQQMQQRFGSLLFSAIGATGVTLPLERLCQCLILSKDLMTVGLEYVGFHAARASGGVDAATPSQALSTSPRPQLQATMAMDSDPCSTMRGSLRLLCSQYVDAVSRESLEKLKTLLGKDDWQRLPLTGTDFVALLATAQAGLRAAFPKAALAAVEGATAAILGTDASLGSPGGVSGLVSLDDSTQDATRGAREGEEFPFRCYSDGVSLLTSWMDRGNPFGHVDLVVGGQDHATIAAATVLHVPRPHTSSADEDEYEDEEEEESGKSNPSGRRAYLRLMRRIHGDGYHLDIALGRGPGLGFGAGLRVAGGVDDIALYAGGREGVGGEDGGQDSDADSEEEEEVTEEDAEDSDSEDSVEGGRHGGRKGDDEGGTFAPTMGNAKDGPFGAIFGGQHQHVVTASALNGFAKAVGKHVLLMEVLPTVASDAFTGLARLFELYLYTVATLFLRPTVQKQLFDVSPPSPSYADSKEAVVFDYMDAAGFTIAARVGASAADAREADHRASGAYKALRKLHGGSAAGMGGGLDSSFMSDSGASTGGGRVRGGAGRAGHRGAGAEGESDTLTLCGVSLHVRGLPALAQAQGFNSDYYISGAGAEAASTVTSNAFSHEGVYVTLRRALQQIGAELSGGGFSRMGAANGSVLATGVFTADGTYSQRGYLPEPYVRLSAGVEIEGEQAAFGLVERAVAAESLDFMVDVLARVRGRLEAHMPSHASHLSSFFTRAVQCSVQLRGLVYHSLVPRILPECGAIPLMIAAVKWEGVKDAMERSDYTREMETFVGRASAMLNERAKNGGLPAVSRFGVWSAIVSHILDRFVEGYSKVKKSSVPGRGLMSLDAATVYAACAKAGPVVPSCLARDKSHVDGYVAAFYYDNEADLLAWVSQHASAYPVRHMRSLLTAGIGHSLKKKAAKDMAAAIDALYLLPMPEEMARQLAMEKGASALGGGLVAMGAAMAGGGLGS